MKNLSFINNELRTAPMDMDYVMRSLRSLEPANKNIQAVYQYLNENPGKLLRPSLLFLLCREYRIKITPDIRKAALVIEIMHNATLLQDDVFDKEHIRRRKPSANLVFGDARTILTSDYLLVKAMDILQDVKSDKIRKAIYKAAYAACSGEMDNCDLDIPDHVTLRNYMLIIEQKTASLFRVCGEIANIQLPRKKSEIVSFTENFGLLYQISDDLADAECLLKGERMDYSLKDIVCLPLIFLMRNNHKNLFSNKCRIDPVRILREMKRKKSYDKSLLYIRRKFSPHLEYLKRQNEILHLILDVFYINIVKFLKERCEG
jgi:geranylgeranyl pyrophosphate synthase